MKTAYQWFKRESPVTKIYVMGLLLLAALAITSNIMVMGIDSVRPPHVPDV